MSDLLALTVPTFPHADDLDPDTRSGRRYPTVNSLGSNSHRGGMKTREYRALFAAVKSAAEGAIATTGWQTADYYCEVHWKRYVVRRRAFDPGNTMKVEMDALEAAGVFVNDSLVIPRPDIPHYDPRPGAVDRISIAVFRLYPPLLLADRKIVTPPAAARRGKVRGAVPPAAAGALVRPYRQGDHIPEGWALLNGELVPMTAPQLREWVSRRR